jgi:two-component system LytT family response regulator
VSAPIRTLIVDDERLARASVRVLLAADREIEIVGECGSAVAAMEAIAQQAPELVFLDVQMPRMDGFGLLASVGPRRFDVVFVTAHDSYALAAFDAQALDYVLKPFDDLRFGRAVERAKARVRQARLERLATEMARVVPPPAAAASSSPAGDEREHIAVRDGERIVCVPLADIDWIGADDYYVQLHVGGRAYLLREPLKELEARLDPQRFVRVHRSAIVALDRVVELRAGAGDPHVRLRDGTKLRLSRSRKTRLRALLGLRRRRAPGHSS